MKSLLKGDTFQFPRMFHNLLHMHGQIELVHFNSCLFCAYYVSRYTVSRHKRMNAGYQDNWVLAAYSDNLSSTLAIHMLEGRKAFLPVCTHKHALCTHKCKLNIVFFLKNEREILLWFIIAKRRHFDRNCSVLYYLQMWDQNQLYRLYNELVE